MTQSTRRADLTASEYKRNDYQYRKDIEVYCGTTRIYGYAGEGYSYQFYTHPADNHNRLMAAPGTKFTVVPLTEEAAAEFALTYAQRKRQYGRR